MQYRASLGSPLAEEGLSHTHLLHGAVPVSVWCCLWKLVTLHQVSDTQADRGLCQTSFPTGCSCLSLSQHDSMSLKGCPLVRDLTRPFLLLPHCWGSIAKSTYSSWGETRCRAGSSTKERTGRQPPKTRGKKPVQTNSTEQNLISLFPSK